MAINPSGVKNTFLSHSVFWVLFLPLLSFIFFPVLFDDQNIDPNEQAMVRTLGVNVEKVTVKTNDLFSSVFIKSGILTATEKFFSGNSFGSAKQMMPVATENTKFAGTWIRGVWTMVYKSIWRFNMLFSIFFIPMLLLCIPAGIDGFTTRAKKRYEFGSHNPVYFYSSLHIAVLVIGLFIYLPLMPITLTANVLAGFLVALTFAIWVAAANFQTGS